jgi:hypothetical protein
LRAGTAGMNHHTQLSGCFYEAVRPHQAENMFNNSVEAAHRVVFL